MHLQTASAISFVAMAAAKYPKEAAKVQAELDAVIGGDRCKYILFCQTIIVAIRSYMPIMQCPHSRMPSYFPE